MRSVFRIVLSVILLTVAAFASTPFWGDKTSLSVETLPSALKPGQFVWSPKNVPEGPMVVIVSLTEQIAYAYRNGLLIGYSAISSGKKGFETPTGVFTTLQKDKAHHSSIYDNAAMPYTQRLTWGGVALHAGGLPGYPSSHGCIHLPSAFASFLYDASPLGMTVVIGAEAKAPVDVVHPSMLSPVDIRSGTTVENPRLGSDEEFRWQPDKSSTGPISILISGRDKRAFVYRNGVEIGRTKITVNRPEKPLGTHVFIVTEAAPTPKDNPKWIAVGVPGHLDENNIPMSPQQVERVTVPEKFLEMTRLDLVPGTTLMVTDSAVLPANSGVTMTVITNDPQPEK